MTPLDPGILRSILAEPDDDAHRLVMADWLEERNGEGDAARAEFIRVQCLLVLGPSAQTDWCHHDLTSPPSCRGCILRRRERELCPGDRLYLPGAKDDYDYVTITEWRRGFVHAITLAAADFLAHADALLAAQPVEGVTLTTWPLRRGLLDAYDKMDWHEGHDRIDRQTLTETLRDLWPRLRFALPIGTLQDYGPA